MKSLQTEILITPQNIEAEEEILSACLFDSEVADEFLDALRSEHFHRTAHQKIFSAIHCLRAVGNPIDLTTIAEELRKRNELEAAGGVSYLSRFTEIPPATSVEYFAGVVHDAFLRRRVIEIANTMMKDTHRPEVAALDLLSSAQEQLSKIEDDHGRSCAESLGTLCFEATDRYEALQKSAGRVIGTPTGFRDLDSTTCGLQPGDLVILAARPSVGKTALAQNMARYAAGAGHPVGFYSMEMNKTSLFDRFVASEASVNSLKFRNGLFSGDDWERITSAQEILYNLPIYIDDTSGLHYTEIRRRARKMHREHGIKIIFIDYLQLMSGDRQSGRVEEVSSISRNLKGIARELNVPVVCLSQLSRSCEQRDNKRPRLSDLRDSGAIEQDADLVAFIYRDEIYNRQTKEPGIAEVDVAKQRNGPTGMFKLRWHSRTMKFSNPER